MNQSTKPIRCLFESHHNLIWRCPEESIKLGKARDIADAFALNFSKLNFRKRTKAVWLSGRRKRVIL